MSKSLLPIGSVVSIKDDNAKLIVIGFYPENDDRSYDYLGALYPQGLLETPSLFLFDVDQVEDVVFHGFIDKHGAEVLDAAKGLMDVRANMNQEILRTVFDYLKEHPESGDEEDESSEQVDFTLG